MGRWRQPQKYVLGVKLFILCESASSWSISEPPGAFSIEQAQKIIGGLKPAPWRCELFILLVMQGAQPYLLAESNWSRLLISRTNRDQLLSFALRRSLVRAYLFAFLPFKQNK
jgi:hypothetical protein